MKQGKIKEAREIAFKERFSFGCAVAANGIGSVMLGSYISYYYTDVAGFTAALAAMIVSICTIFDGFSDILMGVIIDRTHTRFGKTRPWILIGGIVDGILLALSFSVPSLASGTMKVVYAFATYFLLKVVAGTMLGVSGGTLITLITRDEKERNSLGVYNVIFNVVFALGASALTMPLVRAMGDNAGSWRILTLIYGAVIIVLSLIGFKGTKERVTDEAKASEKKVPLPILLKAALTNRYFWLMLIAMVMYNFFGATGSINTYYYTRVLNNVTALSISSLGSLIFLLFMPVYLIICNKMGVRRAMIASCLLTAIIAGIRILAPYSVPVYMGLGWLSTIALGPFSACYMSLTAEIADWGEWKTGIATQAIVCSLISVAAKIAGGLGNGVIGFILDRAGYDGMAEVQPQSAITALIILGTVAGALGYLIMAGCFHFIKVDKDQEQMHKDLEARKAAEADI